MSGSPSHTQAQAVYIYIAFVMKSNLAELFTSPVRPVMIYYLSPFLAVSYTHLTLPTMAVV